MNNKIKVMREKVLLSKISSIVLKMLLDCKYEDLHAGYDISEKWAEENKDYINLLFEGCLKEDEDITDFVKSVEEATHLINYYESLNTYVNRSGKKILVNGDEKKIESLKKYIDKVAEKYN